MITPPKASIYLDTSVINFLFAEDAPQLQELTIQFFEQSVAREMYEVIISQFVVAEIGQTKDENKKSLLLHAIADYNLKLIEDTSTEITALAKSYLEAEIIPAKNNYDALHVAFTTVHKIDFLASLELSAPR